MENKMTQRDYFNKLLKMEEVKADAEMVNFLNSRIALLDKKNSARKTSLTETQKENLEYKDDILEFVKASDKELTTSAIAKHFALSTQRTSPIMAKLVNEGLVTKILVKKVPYYKAA